MEEDKKKKKKTNKKKTTPVKKEVVKKRKNTKKKEIKKSNDLFTTEHILLTVFILLIVIVVVLGIMTYKASKKVKKEHDANIIIPLNQEREDANLSVNAKDLYEAGVYVVKITNYKDNKINKKDVNYTITIGNNSDLELKVYKNDLDQELMNKEKAIEISDKLVKNKKEKVYYTIIASGKKKPSKNQKIGIRISNEKESS